MFQVLEVREPAERKRLNKAWEVRFSWENLCKDLAGLGRDLVELVYPTGIYCICCGRPMDPRFPYSLCGTCVRILHWASEDTCAKCGKPMAAGKGKALCSDCRAEERSFERGFICTRYGERERGILHRFKYCGQAYYGEKLGELMVERLLAAGVKADLVVPVPMFGKKERIRGYNQAALLAKTVARGLGAPYEALLVRGKDTAPMSSLGPQERRENVKGVFSLKEGCGLMSEGKTVLLVDDIFTTGSTVSACSEALLAGGAVRVFALCFSAGGDPGPADALQPAP